MDKDNQKTEIERAIELVEQARDIMTQVMQHSDLQRYYNANGEFGFHQLLGLGNPHDNGLQSIINSL